MSANTNRPKYSAIIPVGPRIDDLIPLILEYNDALESTGQSFEIILVLDGRKDSWFAKLSEIVVSNEHIRVLELSRAFGESAALSAGFDVARGEKILTLPAYNQVEPTEILRLVDLAKDDDDMLIAVRPRKGASFDKLRRWTFHALFRWTSGMAFRDLGCGVRLLTRDVAAEIPLYGDQYRFLPALARRRGFKVREVELLQSSKDMFRGRYKLREYLHRFLDILTVFFLVRFTKKPLRFFGTLGFMAAALGGVVTLVLVVQRLFFDMALADRPALLLATLLLVLGVQTFALGLVGELIIFTHASSMKEYTIRRVIESDATKASTSHFSAAQGD